MSRRFLLPAARLFVAAVGLATAAQVRAAETPSLQGIVCPHDASFGERLAAKEIRRYAYLRDGKLLPIVDRLEKVVGTAIVVGNKSQPTVRGVIADAALATSIDGLSGEQYRLKSIHRGGRSIVLVVGGGEMGTLYAAYRLAEWWGIRFYLHGDVVPESQSDASQPGQGLAPPQLDELASPLFDRRGIQPFHDFPEGPDWWSVDDYKAVLSQLPKLRMNFFGLHTYPEGGVGPEPLVWIGRGQDAAADGRVRFSYPSRHFTAANGTWGYQAMPSSSYLFGAAALFDRDDYGADYMRGMTPWPKTPADSNALFDRMGGVLHDVFGYARRLGIKTCLGTETPLVIPKLVKQHLKELGSDAANPAVAQSLYEGLFQRIMHTHPLDYYWFWTPEGWTWTGAKQPQVDATLADLRAAIAAAAKVKAPFTLATCGWVLGPPQNRALFDHVLPKDMPMSCISRQVGHDPVEPGFAKLQGRPKWAIPWMEDDPALNSPQLWVGRMRRDAADALKYGCTGLMGIHWRTQILGPNVSALAAAAWDQSVWNPGKKATVAPPRPEEGADGGKYARFKASIAGADESAVYQTVRFDVFAYRLDLPNGSYRVTLKFCEPHYKEPGKRMFGVNLQGQPVIEHLDIFAKVGRNKALDFAFPNVAVRDGRLTIDFVHEVEYPAIAAIVVEGPVTRKINCGGPAYKDYQADWPPSEPSQRQNFLPTHDFYADWARAQFGPAVAAASARVFEKIDGYLPRPTDWVNGPGGIHPDPRPWEVVAKEYAFVDDFARLRYLVDGRGSLGRFDYWLNNFRYLRANAQVDCAAAQCDAAMRRVRSQKDPAAQRKLARELALPAREELVARLTEMHQYLLATVSTSGELGNVVNWQQHVMPRLLDGPGKELAKLLGADLPAGAMPPVEYQGNPRLIVPTTRGNLLAGEPLRLTAILLGAPGGTPVVY